MLSESRSLLQASESHKIEENGLTSRSFTVSRMGVLSTCETYLGIIPKVNSHAKSPFHIVYSYFWGPSRVGTILGYRNFDIFDDDFSRCTWIILMKDH